MSEKWKQFKVWAIVIACCMLALGVVLVIWPGISAVAVCWILGVLCLALGVVETVRYFKLGLAGIFFRFDLALGICSILMGLVFIIHPAGAAAVLPVAIGVYMIFGSVFCIQLAVELHRFQSSDWTAALIWGILGALMAFLLILDPFHGAAALMIFAGIALIVGGVQSLYIVGCISREVKAGRDGHIIEAEWRSAE